MIRHRDRISGLRVRQAAGIVIDHLIMELILLAFAATSVQASASWMAGQREEGREVLLLDPGWRFHTGDAASPEGDFGYGMEATFAKAGETVGAIKTDFNDTAWRVVDLPHDWAVELGFVNVDNDNIKSHGYKPVGRQFPQTSIGWYRRAFTVPAADTGKRISVRFDGVFRDCIVWMNGHYLGRNLSGYSEFSFDVTDYIYCGRRNVIVVRVDATQPEGWFYEGAGIYRHVWLIKTNPVHIPEYGITIRCVLDTASPSVRVATEIINASLYSSRLRVSSTILDRTGTVVATARTKFVSIPAGIRIIIPQVIPVRSPHRWSTDDPYCYRLETVVTENGSIVDRMVTRIGMRTGIFDKDRGFLLNGKRIEIKGVCCHQDHAGVGSALPDRLQFYRIERLKEMGVNALRTSHNPPTRELLDACDSLGMMVMDENRLMGSTEEMNEQFARLIRRDRNHPSVIIWSIGNEEWMIQSNETGTKIARSLLRCQTELDPTRVSTYAANNGNDYRGINSIIPVRGINYMNISDIDKYRKDHPDQPLVGSEEASTVCTRGIYMNDTIRGYVSDYDVNRPRWGAIAEQWWKFYAEREWLAGAFVWTGFDYRGEPTPYGWPCINSHFGIMDVCGFPKNNYYYYQSWWSARDVLHIAPHWNWTGMEGKSIDVWCQSNCDTVELLLNSRSLGAKPMPKNSHLEWKVPWQKGILEARGVREGRACYTATRTTGEPVRLVVSADRPAILADGEDVCVVTVSVADSDGFPVPDAGVLVGFNVEGPGKIIGVGNGDPSSHEPDKFLDGRYQRRLFNGVCQVLVQSARSPGNIVLRCSSPGLSSGVIEIVAASTAPRPFVPLMQ